MDAFDSIECTRYDICLMVAEFLIEGAGSGVDLICIHAQYMAAAHGGIGLVKPYKSTPEAFFCVFRIHHQSVKDHGFLFAAGEGPASVRIGRDLLPVDDCRCSNNAAGFEHEQIAALQCLLCAPGIRIDVPVPADAG